MLTELKVSHFAIIDKIHIHFNNGLNILSGETGAGKSILMKSLGLLMGAKSSQQDIRSGQEQASIEGAFDVSQRQDILEKLQDMGIETDEGELIVRRLLQRSGKSKVYLNGHLSTLSDLRRIVFPLVTMGDPTEIPLVEMTGQHENKDLMSLRYQMDTLDQFCGNLILREKVRDLYSGIKKISERMQELEAKSQLREQQIDFLEFQIQEIESLNPAENEDEEILAQIKSLKSRGQWQEWIQASDETLNSGHNSVLSLINFIIQKAPDSPALKEVKDQLLQTKASLEDISFQLQQMGSNVDEIEDNSLEELEDRLNRIRKLQKKFGHSVNEIIQALADMKKEHGELTHLSQTLSELEQEKQALYMELIRQAKKLRQKRLSGAELLSKEVNVELKDLNMKGLQFEVVVEELEEASRTGLDRVVFRTRSGRKEEARDLSKAASGGELSRILLSLKQVVGSSQHPRTFLFDEVDTGVSGPTAEKVGAKLKNLATHQQVICVTHLPQVASFGDYHYFIDKEASKDHVEMTVQLLNKKERVEEIARLISGEKLTKTSIAHAKKLLEL
jgi:DNA repair protein RecN (Recombination protein N)